MAKCIVRVLLVVLIVSMMVNDHHSQCDNDRCAIVIYLRFFQFLLCPLLARPSPRASGGSALAHRHARLQRGPPKPHCNMSAMCLPVLASARVARVSFTWVSKENGGRGFASGQASESWHPGTSQYLRPSHRIFLTWRVPRGSGRAQATLPGELLHCICLQ